MRKPNFSYIRGARLVNFWCSLMEPVHVLGSIVYNRAISIQMQNFLKVVIHMIILLTTEIKPHIRQNAGNGYL